MENQEIIKFAENFARNFLFLNKYFAKLSRTYFRI
jgi:hypothetical protein